MCKNNKGFSAKFKGSSVEQSPQNLQFCVPIIKEKIINLAKCKSENSVL